MALAVAVAVALTEPAAARADSFTVTGTSDGGVCADTVCPSVRAALESAQDGDTIVVGAGEHRLTLGQLTVTRSVTLVGAGAHRTRIVGEAEQNERVLEVGGDLSVQPSVTVARMTLAQGAARCSSGGNVRNHGTLRLDHVRVTGGVAETGGGLANFGSLELEHSLVDANVAGFCEVGGVGGGIYSEGLAPDTLVVRDSTVTANGANTGGGIVAVDVSQTDRPVGTRLTRVTLARNAASVGAGGLYLNAGARASVSGSILAENTIDPPSLAFAAVPEPSNCGRVVPEDGGGNLADFDDCGVPVADARLGALAEGLGETPVLPIPRDSPAVDHAGACRGADQRDLARPQGAACDAGAYELAIAPAIESGPSGTTTDASPMFTFVGSPAFECRLDGPGGAGAWEVCASPKTYAGLTVGDYVFRVRPAGAATESARAFAVMPATVPPPVVAAQIPVPTPTATPQPEYRRSVVVRPTKGTVKIRLPGTRRYVALDTVDELPLGASVDVRNGRVRLYAASAGGARQAASFYGGVFRIAQRGRHVDLELRGPKPTCGSNTASTSTHEPKKKRKARKRRLWGSGRGAFRTSGRYSAATVRGTTWLVEDRCRSTLTRVRVGVVTVRDFKRKRTIRLRAGQRYVARR